MKLFKQHKPCYIVAVTRPGMTVSEIHSHVRCATRYLESRGVPFKQVRGRFMGHAEVGFVLDDADREAVQAIAWKHDQDVVMWLSETRRAYFITGFGTEHATHTDGGQWQQVTRPDDSEDYTYDPSTRQHFVVR